MIKAKHKFFMYSFFRFYTNRKFKKNFSSVRIIGETEDKGLPVLLISNHLSWWDGFFILHVNENRFKRKFHFMMLEEQLRKYWFFKYSGGYSVKKNSKSIIESLNYTATLLKDRNNLVTIFPQGEIQSVYRQEILFERGIEKILKQAGKVQIIFLAILTDFFSNSKPGINLYLDEYNASDYSVSHLQLSYNDFYRRSIDKQLKEKR